MALTFEFGRVGGNSMMGAPYGNTMAAPYGGKDQVS